MFFVIKIYNEETTKPEISKSLFENYWQIIDTLATSTISTK